MTASIIIRKQKFRIRTAEYQTAAAVRSKITDQLQYELLPVFEEVFGQLGKEDIFFDKLSINLGRCTEDELRSNLPSLLKNGLIEKMKNYGEDIIYANERNDTGIYNDDIKGKTENTSTDTITAVLHFLEKGVYPWWFNQNIEKKPERLLEKLNAKETEDFVLRVIILLRKLKEEKRLAVVQRLIQHAETGLVKKLIASYTHLQSDEGLRKNIAYLGDKNISEPVAAFFNTNIQGYNELLLSFLFFTDGHSAKTGDIIIKEFITYMFKKTGKQKGRIISDERQTKQDNRGTITMDKKIFQNFPEEIKKAILDIEAEDIQNKESLIQEKKETGDDSSIKKQKKNVTEKNSWDPVTGEDGIFISNAGLVILHPFLQPLFKELNLVNEEGEFETTEHQRKAAVILYYLQTGNGNYREYDMAFNKILCNIETDAVLPADIQLSGSEMKECDNLLRTVVQYWEALKGSGIDALRETFIQRNGKVSQTDGNYKLQVERNAMDILVDKLPWGISIIKLPWRNNLIYTEW